MKRTPQKTNLVVSGLIDYLEETGQTNLLPDVTHILEKELQKDQNTEEIIVTSSIPLSKNQITKLKILLYKLLHVDLPILNRLDKSLLGGFTIQIGDWFLDASLIKQFDNLRYSLYTK